MSYCWVLLLLFIKTLETPVTLRNKKFHKIVSPYLSLSLSLLYFNSVDSPIQYGAKC